MAKIKIKTRSYSKMKLKSSNSNEENKESGRIFKFAPQTVGQRNNYATFATIKEKIIQCAQVKMHQGHDIKCSIESEKILDFDDKKPKLDIIEIEEIMAETDGMGDDETVFYTPNREPTEKETRKLTLIQDRYNKLSLIHI